MSKLDQNCSFCLSVYLSVSLSSLFLLFVFLSNSIWTIILGSGIAQWLGRRTRDWKVAGSNPCRSSGRIFFSGVDFLCWLLFRYPLHPRVTAVARKRYWSFCRKCRWQVTAEHTCTQHTWLQMKRHCKLVHGCMVYTDRAPRRQQFLSLGISHVTTKIAL